MSHTVVTLICNPDAPLLNNELTGKLSRHLIDTGYTPSDRRALAQGVAEEYIFHSLIGPQEVQSEIKKFLDGLNIDVIGQQSESRRKRLLIADMDSTIIQQECIDELAEFAGKRAEISAITERAMRGELDFESALKERVAMLKGLPVDVLQQAFDERITLTPGARTLVQTMNAAGAITALVSGGFTFFTSRIKDTCGFQIHQANELLIVDGKLTGDVAAPILGRQAKEDALKNIAEQHGVPPEKTLAVGDGANDLSMLKSARLGVAFHAKPEVAQAASAQVNHSDLTALLYLQGIAQREFVSD